MSVDGVESFASMFKARPDPRRRLEDRHDREKDAQKSRAQLSRRTAERTAQINFRCSPAFRERLKQIVDLDNEQPGPRTSMADVLEEALEFYAKAKGYGDRE